MFLRLWTHPLRMLVLGLFVCAAIYLLGLGSAYAPTNGDEMVYIHIARLTAQSGHWLPLVSDLGAMRNTKPPLLFWQAMVAGDWGGNWNVFSLRLPSVLYTFATAALVGWMTHRMTRQARTGLLAALVYLLFFSSFRYCRAYLTSAPETFWMGLPMFFVWWLSTRSYRPNTTNLAGNPLSQYLTPWSYTLIGLSFGLGMLYKSFALLAPASIAVGLALLVIQRERVDKTRAWQAFTTTAGVTWAGLLSLGIFALWFVLDPDPAAVWREFVAGENAGKMASAQGYWHDALWGNYPIWTQLWAYPENAGLQFFMVVGLGVFALQTLWKALWQTQSSPSAHLPKDAATWVLIIWIGVWLLVFSLPSQRSARYVIPAMPAIAALMAMHWDKIGRLWFQISLACMVPALVILGRIAWVLGDVQWGERAMGDALLLAGAVGLAAISGCVAIVGLFYARATRTACLIASLGIYATFGLMVAPFGSEQGQFSPRVQAAMAGKRVAVPNGFTGQYERYTFLLPTAQLQPYDALGRQTGVLKPELADDERLPYLLAQFDAVVWIESDLKPAALRCAPGCQAIAERMFVKSRHRAGEITLANIWYPQQWLIGRELLLQTKPLSFLAPPVQP